MKTFRRLVLLGAVVLETGCGLPDTFYLAPPVYSGQFGISTPAAAILGASRASDIDIQFLGYELYYKFYAPSAPDSTIVQDSNYGGSGNTINDLSQHGFQRICLGPGNEPESPDQAPGFSSAPLINIKSIDPGNLNGGGFTIKIVLDVTLPPPYGFTTTWPLVTNPPLPVSYFTYSPPGSGPTGGMEIRRFVQENPYFENGKYCSSFASNYHWVGQSPQNYDPSQPAQVDVAQINSGDWTIVQSGNQVYVLMYAVCYGTATDQTIQRSSPTYLGYTEIPVLNSP